MIRDCPNGRSASLSSLSFRPSNSDFSELSDDSNKVSESSKPLTRDFGESQENDLGMTATGPLVDHFSQEFGIVGDDGVYSHSDQSVHGGDFVDRPNMDFEILLVCTANEIARHGGSTHTKEVGFQFGNISQGRRDNDADTDLGAGGFGATESREV